MPPPAPPPANVEVEAMIQVGLTADGKLLLAVQPPGLNAFTVMGILQKAVLAAELRTRPGAAAGPKIEVAPPGFQVPPPTHRG